MANRSKQKGSRAERQLVKEIQALQLEAKRVPLSGAAEGFKGDVLFTYKGTEYAIEAKCRRDLFASIYDMYYEYISVYKCDTLNLVLRGDNGVLINMSVSLLGVLSPDDCVYKFPHDLKLTKMTDRVLSKIANLQKLLGKAHILAIKNDRRPFIFIKYRS